MSFYSYDYILNQIQQDNWVLIGLFAVLFLATAVTSFRAYKDKRDSKYRELVIIFGLLLLVTALSGWDSYQSTSQSNNQYQTSLHFIENVSQSLGVKPQEVYVNTSAETNGALLYVDGNFYRAISGNQPDTYLLEKMDLHSFDLELVEVNQWIAYT